MDNMFIEIVIRNMIFNIIKLVIIFCLIQNATGWNGFVVFIVSLIVLSVWNFVWTFIKGLLGIL